MIENTDQMITIAKQIEEFDDRVYREFPQTMPKAPFAVLSVISMTADFVSEGREVIASITYSVDVYADAPDDCADIASELNDLYSQYNIIRVGGSTGFDSDCSLYRVNTSLRATLDSRGGSYH